MASRYLRQLWANTLLLYAEVVGFLANTVFPSVAQGFVVGSKAKDVVTNNGVSLSTIAGVDAGDFAGTDNFVVPSPILRADNVAWEVVGWMVFDDFAAVRVLCGVAISKIEITNTTTVTFTNTAAGSVTWTISALSTATPVFFVISSDGTDTDNLELFIDNVSQGTRTLADSSFNVNNIGQGGGGNHLGEITGIGFFSAQLTSGNRTELYNSGTPLPHTSWSAGLDTNLTEVYDFIPLPDPWPVGNAQIDWANDGLRAFTYVDANGRLVCQTTKPNVPTDTFSIKDKNGNTFARLGGRSIYVPFNKVGNRSDSGWSLGLTTGNFKLGIAKGNTENLVARTPGTIDLTENNVVDELDPLEFLYVLQSTGGFIFIRRRLGQLPQLIFSELTQTDTPLHGLIGLRDPDPGPIEVDNILIDDLLDPFDTDAAYFDHDESAPSDDSERELDNGVMLTSFIWDSNTGVDAAAIAFHFVDASNFIEVRGEADGSVVLRTRVATVNTDDTLGVAATLTDGETVYVVLHGAHVTVYGTTAGFVGSAHTDEITAAMLAEKTSRVTEMSNASLTNLKIGKIYPVGAARTELARLMTVTKNLSPLEGLISWIPCVRPFWGDQQPLDMAEAIGGTHVDAPTQWSLGANFAASTDDPSYVSDPASLSVGLDFDGGDHVRALATKTATGDFLVQFCVLLDSLTSETLLAGNANDDFVQIVNSTTLRVSIAGANHDFTIAALGTAKYNLITIKREGTDLQVRINGATNTEITGVSSDTFAMDDIGSDNTPGNFINGKIADFMGIQATYTDAEMDAEETTMKNRVKDIHGIVEGDFA